MFSWEPKKKECQRKDSNPSSPNAKEENWKKKKIQINLSKYAKSTTWVIILENPNTKKHLR